MSQTILMFDNAEYVVGEDGRLALQPYALPRRRSKGEVALQKKDRQRREGAPLGPSSAGAPAFVMFRLRSLGFSSPGGLQLDRCKIGEAYPGHCGEEAILPLAHRPDLVKRLPRQVDLADQGLELILADVIGDCHPVD
jgi:hypothetical protein